MSLLATISSDRLYRYALWRQWWRGTRVLNIIGLNPSTADDTHDDPTVRRCVALAKHHGFDALELTNLFAWRATDPRELSRVADAVGVANDQAIHAAASKASTVVCAWGARGGLHDRDTYIEGLLHSLNLQCFGITRDGFPRHPLYLPTAAQLQPLASFRY